MWQKRSRKTIENCADTEKRTNIWQPEPSRSFFASLLLKFQNIQNFSMEEAILAMKGRTNLWRLYAPTKISSEALNFPLIQPSNVLHIFLSMTFIDRHHSHFKSMTERERKRERDSKNCRSHGMSMDST